MLIKLQIVREGTKYESFRFGIPKALVEAHKWRNKKFEVTIKDKSLILTPTK